MACSRTLPELQAASRGRSRTLRILWRFIRPAGKKGLRDFRGRGLAFGEASRNREGIEQKLTELTSNEYRRIRPTGSKWRSSLFPELNPNHCLKTGLIDIVE